MKQKLFALYLIKKASLYFVGSVFSRFPVAFPALETKNLSFFATSGFDFYNFLVGLFEEGKQPLFLKLFSLKVGAFSLPPPASVLATSVETGTNFPMLSAFDPE